MEEGPDGQHGHPEQHRQEHPVGPSHCASASTSSSVTGHWCGTGSGASCLTAISSGCGRRRSVWCARGRKNHGAARSARSKSETYLFTSGYVPWWDEFPGAHIPAPIQIGSAGTTDLEARSREILTLLKMNWNSSDGITRLPVTLLFAKKVGEIMTNFPTM
jgi:hypothetical protein